MNNFEHLDEIEKVVHTLVATTQHSEEEIMRWNMQDMLTVYRGVAELFEEVGTEFYPIFEFHGLQYGFQPISKMTLAEWMDLDKRLENPMENLEEILAILYRRITTHKFDDKVWKAKSYIKTLMGKSEDLFKLYEVEEYDVETREWRKDIFQDLPIEYGLGCLTFFLGFGLLLQKDLVRYSPNTTEKMKKVITEQIEEAVQSLSSTNGSTYYETWKQGKY